MSTVREARRRRLIAARRRRRSMWMHRLAAAAAVAVTIAVVTAGEQRKAGDGGALAALLSGIPQHGNTLGEPTAPVTITEYGDLTCPVGRTFARGSEAQLISGAVAGGQAKLVYRGFETTSATANDGTYAASQIAARAAGLQNRAWYYILMFYDRQQAETTRYVTDGFMHGIAAAVPGPQPGEMAGCPPERGARRGGDRRRQGRERGRRDRNPGDLRQRPPRDAPVQRPQHRGSDAPPAPVADHPGQLSSES